MKKLKFLLFLFPFFFTSCEKEKIEGPSLNDLFADLEILEPLSVVGDSADFASGQNIYFTASFSKQLDWKIKIEGLSSGSVKIILGKSNEINQSNSTWLGNSSSLPFFIKEDCKVLLSFEVHDETISSQLNIQEEKNYQNENTVLITDLENNFNPNFTGFFQSGCTRALAIGGAGQKDKYLAQFGTCDWDWLIGYVDYFSNFWYDDKNNMINDPSKLYFNIMIKGDSTISSVTNLPNSLFKLEFYEDENGDNYHDANSEDRFDLEFEVNWTGWRMVSLCYNDLIPPATNPGNGIKQPDKIFKVRTLLLANPDSGPARADVDFLIWSNGAPILN
jgi:hypothetical protein